MEDDKLSDGESKISSEPSDPESPKMGGKKLKLNDGSSQESLQESAPSTSKDDNADSGVSVDKSESTSSDDKGASTSAGPSNEVVHVAASGSNVKAILLNIRQPNHRNYRKRKTPDHDSDSNGSSRDIFDSDDLSADETIQPTALRQEHLNIWDTDSSVELHISPSTDVVISATNSSSSSDSSPSHNYASSDSEAPPRMHSGDTDTDEEAPHVVWNNHEAAPADDQAKTPDVLTKERPKHNYLLLKEIIHREMGLTFPYGKATKEDVMFCHRFYGSLHSVYRLKKLHALNKHRGCVNSINFHPEGKLLVSGSDDQNIVVWDWAKNTALATIKTGHKSNVFQSKFLYLNAQSQLNIVTCARDGQVRLIQCPPAGGAGSRRRLCAHTRAAHKLHVCPQEPHSVLSAGEDGLVMHCDLRTDHANRLFHVREKNSIPLYSVHGHPLEPKELIVAGRDKFIRLYDRRKCTRPLALYCPNFFEKTAGTKRMSLTHLTCAIYNHNGSEILGSYNDEDIYLFDTVKNVYDKQREKDTSIDGYIRSFSGHRNSATFKGVSFFGPNSEYVVSGSDCSHIYIWSKSHESIVQWMKGDDNGVVNCIEAHPKSPILASSGLDRDVKIWSPQEMADPTFDGMERVVRDNSMHQISSPLFNDFLPHLYSAWRERNENRNGDLMEFGGNIEIDGNVCTTF